MALYTEMINKKLGATRCVPEQPNIKLKYANQQSKRYPCKIKRVTEKKALVFLYFCGCITYKLSTSNKSLF